MTITLQAHNFTINAVGGIIDSRTPNGVQANRAPVIATIPILTVAPGSITPLGSYGSDPDGDSLSWGRTQGALDTGPVGLRLSTQASLSIDADVPDGDYYIEIYADDGRDTAESDWLRRAGLTKDSQGVLMVDLSNSAAAGVVWAHDFRHPNESRRFSASSPMAGLDGVEYKTGQSMDLTAHNHATFETALGYKTMLEFNSGALPGANSGYIRSVMPNPIAYNGWPADTWFRWNNAQSEIRVIQPNGTQLPSSTTFYWSKQNNHLRMHAQGNFWRPMSPIVANDNGLPYADNAARGTIPRINWATSQYTQSTWQQALKGFWTHSAFAADGDEILGHEYWLQMRVRITGGMHTPRADVSGGQALRAARWSAYQNPNQMLEFPPDGKLSMILASTSLAEEIITNTGMPISGQIAYGGHDTSYARMYTRQGSPHVAYPFDGSYTGRHLQTNETHDSAYHVTCRIGQDLNQPNACWEYPEDEWFTIMYHVRPGRPCSTSDVRTAEYPETLLEVKVARWGETQWTTLYYDDTIPLVYGDPYDPTTYNPATPGEWEPGRPAPGHNVIGLMAYKNDAPSFRECAQEYTQVIFSTQPIPCPQVY